MPKSTRQQAPRDCQASLSKLKSGIFRDSPSVLGLPHEVLGQAGPPLLSLSTCRRCITSMRSPVLSDLSKAQLARFIQSTCLRNTCEGAVNCYIATHAAATSNLQASAPALAAAVARRLSQVRGCQLLLRRYRPRN